MKLSSLSLVKYALAAILMLFFGTVYSQYPATGNKQRLGWQTTGDGLVWRGAIADTSTLDPSGLNNAWMLIDTSSGNLYAYRQKAWRLVSGGGGATMPFDSVTFNINEGDASERELKYSADKGYLQYGAEDSIQIPLLPGIWYVRNDTSVTIPKGTVLRATGTLGASGRIKVKHMIANGSIPAMYILGIAMHDIAVGADGYIMSQGKIRQVNTQAYSQGAVLYADVDTLGGLTQTEPTGGNLKLPIAFVVHSASNGTLAVRITTGNYLHEAHDVDTAGITNNSVLRYDSATALWKASTSPGIIGSGTANYLPKFTGSSAVGNSPLYNVADNKFIIGHTASGTGAKNTLEIRGTGNTDLDGTKIDLYVNSSGQEYHSPIISLRRSRSATAGGFVKADSLDWLGQVIFNGADGDEYTGGALIRAIVDGITGNNDMPASLLFATTSNGSSTPTERMRITSTGRVGIATTSPARSLHISATDAIRIPVGATGGAGSSANGDIRYNSTENNFEWYQQSTGNWRQPVVSASSTGLATAGRVFYADADGKAAANDDLYWDATNNRLGINQPSPQKVIDVIANSQNDGIKVFVDSNITIGGFPAIEFTRNGITSAPRNMNFNFIHHGNFDFSRGVFVFERSRGSSYNIQGVKSGDYIGSLTFVGYDDTGARIASTAQVNAIADADATTGTVPQRLSFVTGTTAANRPERMVIKSDGNVGIGTTSPTATLHLKAGTAAANTAPLKFTSGTNTTTPEAGAVEWNGTNMFVTNSSATRQTVNQGLTASATIDFLSTNAQNSRDVTVTVTGAADGDPVSLGVPNAAVNINTCYTAWVSAANTVTIRFNNYSSGAVNPAQGDFKIFVTKY